MAPAARKRLGRTPVFFKEALRPAVSERIDAPPALYAMSWG